MSSGTTATSDQRPGWWVYMVESEKDRRLYVGASTDPEHRLRQHNGELVGGARFTRKRRPVRLVYVEYVGDKIAALRREWRLKHIPVEVKRALIAGDEGADARSRTCKLHRRSRRRRRT